MFLSAGFPFQREEKKTEAVQEGGPHFEVTKWSGKEAEDERFCLSS